MSSRTMRTRPVGSRNKPGPALATLATWIAAFAWLGWRGLVVAFIAGCVMAFGTLRNAGLV